MRLPWDRGSRRRDSLMMYLEATPGVCLLVGLGRRLVAGVGRAVGALGGSRTGPIHVDIDAPAASVYAIMTRFEGEAGPAADHPVQVDGLITREFVTLVKLPLGITRTVRTREEIRLVPPRTLEFRHLAGPVRGMTEVIAVEPIGEERCRVTYSGVLPPSGPLLRIAYRLLARPAIERIVRAHLTGLARQADDERATNPAP